ncbi:MAG: hypothetical protein M4579_001023 [Chaenotheca gracillima]|nr:MAG: hypothetical protein M4579_001023 [Chaenotheca gracillima]
MHTEEEPPRMTSPTEHPSPSSPSPTPDSSETPPTTAPLETPTPAPFKAAPVPSVNIWQQRKESQVTKFKPAGAPPPRSSDSKLWPTLDLAQNAERKKAQDKLEKSDKDRLTNGTATKSQAHGKEKWTVVPYTPTAVFETPIARRGGRPSRGRGDASARGAASSAPHPSNGREKVPNGTAIPSTPGAAAGNLAEANRSDPALGKATAPPFKSPRKMTRGGPQAAREPRKPQPGGAPERRNESSDPALKNGTASHTAASRRTSVSTQTEPNGRKRENSRSHSRRESNVSLGHFPPNSSRGDRYRANTGDSQTHPRSTFPDRRAEGVGRGADVPRENGTSFPRGDPRSERGRGGSAHRGGRGGLNGVNYTQQPPAFPNPGNKPRNINGFPPPLSKTTSLGSPGQEAPHPQTFNGGSYTPGAHQQGRNYRGGPRSQSIPNSATFGSFNGYPGSPLHMPPIKTQFGTPGYEYQAMPPLSAMPYTPYVEQYNTMGALLMQLEYYFSVDNLLKDMYLRKHMDSQGCVPLNFIARFNRVQQINGDIEMVRSACYHSSHIEIWFAPDGSGNDRVRKREGWEQWVLAMEERDASARNDGPVELQQPWMHQTPQEPSQYFPFANQSNSPDGGSLQRPVADNEDARAGLDISVPSFVPFTSPADDLPPPDTATATTNGETTSNTNGITNGEKATEAATEAAIEKSTGPGTETKKETNNESSEVHPKINGDPQPIKTPVAQTPLSAAVPDFSPGMVPIVGNGTISLNGGESEQQN